MSSGYGVTNLLAGLAATAFTWSSGFTTDRSKLNDGVMDEPGAGSSSAQASGQTLAFDLGSAVALGAIAILNHNLAVGACTVKVEAADDAGFTTNLVTAKAATTINTGAPYQKDTVLQFASVTKRYWRLVFVHTGSKTITIGELLALAFNAVTVLSRQTVYGAGESERYVQNRVVSDTGNARAIYLAGPIRTKRLPFKELKGKSQRDELTNMWRATRGGALNLLFIDLIEQVATAGTSDGQACIWGKLQDELAWSESDFQVFDVDELVIVSLGREVGA